MPRCASSVTCRSTLSTSVTNISPNVRGSMKRSWPPWVNVITTWVCLSVGSRAVLLRTSCPDMPRWITRTSSPSSRHSRYFPRRSTPVIFLPTRRLANCLRLWWRRTARIPSASTFLTFFPTTSRSRSRRTTSTSGSSGIGFPLDPDGRHLVLQPLPGFAGCTLLSGLLRPSLAAPVHADGELHGCEEPLRVIGALVTHLVARHLVEQTRRELLEPRLVVAAAGTGRLFANLSLQGAEHHAPRRVHPAVEVHGRDHRLHCVGEDRSLLTAAGGVLALAET